MGYGSCQLDVSHTLSADTGLCYLYAASVADNALVTNLLVFTTMTLAVLAWSKYTLTEQTILLRL